MEMIKHKSDKIAAPSRKNAALTTRISNLTTGLAGIVGGYSLGVPFGEAGMIAGSFLGGLLLYFLAAAGNNAN